MNIEKKFNKTYGHLLSIWKKIICTWTLYFLFSYFKNTWPIFNMHFNLFQKSIFFFLIYMNILKSAKNKTHLVGNPEMFWILNFCLVKSKTAFLKGKKTYFQFNFNYWAFLISFFLICLSCWNFMNETLNLINFAK